MSFFGNRRQQDPEPTPAPRAPQPAQPSAPPAPHSPAPIGFETVLGANTSLTGDLVSDSNVRLDGTFTGTLQINGNVLIGETAKINADVNARNISIAGAVRGNVNGKKVQLLRTGRVWGDITATALATEEGAFIDGKISMVSHKATSARLDGDSTTDANRATDTVEAVAASEAVSEAVDPMTTADDESATKPLDDTPDFIESETEEATPASNDDDKPKD